MPNPGGYRAWKQAVPDKPKEVNSASFTEFPDLIKATAKPTVFQGMSLAARLKEAIAAEEEAAILKRLKKGDTPEQILRESCVVLPCKGLKAVDSSVPDWVTDTQSIVVGPMPRVKTLEDQIQERKWRRLGITPSISIWSPPDQEEEYEPDTVSLPSDTESLQEEEEEQNLEL